MKKLKLQKVNAGSYRSDLSLVGKIQDFNNGFIEIPNDRKEVELRSLNGDVIKSSLDVLERDMITNSYIGRLDDGTEFRVVEASDSVNSITRAQGLNDLITFAGLKGDSFAIHFELTELSAADKELIARNNLVTNENDSNDDDFIDWLALEKIAITRVLLDIMQADGYIDSGEVKYMNQLRLSIGISDDMVEKAHEMGVSFCINILKKMSYNKKIAIGIMMSEMISSDGDIDQAEVEIFNVVFNMAEIPMPTV